MKTLKIFLITLFAASMHGCVTLKEPIITKNEKVDNYEYVVIPATSTLNSSTGVVAGGQYGVYGGSTSKEINPGSLIEGILLKRGIISVDEIRPDIIDKTLIAKYGESGRRAVFWGYTLEVTIVLIDANTNETVYSCTAEGIGSTETDDIRKAIHRCLSEF